VAFVSSFSSFPDIAPWDSCLCKVSDHSGHSCPAAVDGALHEDVYHWGQREN
jgi:hypothetical protein